MRGRMRLPMVVIALALLGLIALLATLQYRWLGRISDAERDHMRATLNTRASGFAQDFDGELTRAYLLFQLDPESTGSVESRIALRYERWQSTARYPPMIKDIYSVVPAERTPLRRFNPATRALEPAGWPSVLQPIRAQLSALSEESRAGSGFVVRTIPPPIWDTIPALVIPMPLLLFNRDEGLAQLRMMRGLSYVVVLKDRAYITGEMLPALAQQHFRQTGDGFDYELAVVSSADQTVVYHSTTEFMPRPDAA